MPPPNLKKPEWFLKNIVSRKPMLKLGERIGLIYDNLFEEMVYRAHHNSYKISYADIFYSDFVDYIVKACGLKRNFWKYLPEESTLRYMHERRKKFFRYLKKPREKRKYHMFGDVRWSFDFWLSQLSFWYITVKSFYEVWYEVVFENYTIPQAVRWKDAIVLYVIYDFIKCFNFGREKCVKKKWIKRYEKYLEIERSSLLL